MEYATLRNSGREYGAAASAGDTEEDVAVRTKKKPTPRRVGTDGTMLEQLNWLRINRPAAYDRLMKALAELVAIARRIDD